MFRVFDGIEKKYTARVPDEDVKGKVLPYSLPSVGPGADPGVQAVRPQVTFKPSSIRLPLLSARPAVTTAAFTRRRQRQPHTRLAHI